MKAQVILEKDSKKKLTFVNLGGGVKKFRNVNFLKVVFKIHFKLFYFRQT